MPPTSARKPSRTRSPHAQLNWKPGQASGALDNASSTCVSPTRCTFPRCRASLAGRPLAVVPEITPGWFGAMVHSQLYRALSPTRDGPGRRRRLRPEHKSSPPFSNGSSAPTTRCVSSSCAPGEYDVNRVRFKNPFVPCSVSPSEQVSRSCETPTPASAASRTRQAAPEFPGRAPSSFVGTPS